MTTDEFKEWTRLHCKHTAADATVATTLTTNREIITDRWHATYAELCECTQRLIEKKRTPKFPNEHLDAIHTELDDLRIELRNAALPAIPERPISGHFDADCVLCGASGYVVVPHPRCIWHGQLVLCQGLVETCAVICDSSICTAGKRAMAEEDRRDTKKHQRRPTFTSYTRMIHGADGLTMLRNYEHQRSRMGEPFGGDFETVYPEIVAKLNRRTKGVK